MFAPVDSRRMGRRNALFLFIIFSFGLSVVGSAQEEPSNTGSNKQTAVTENISPGFAVESLVKEVRGVVGQQVDFSFSVTNLGTNRRLKIRPVLLGQNRNGSIIIRNEEASPENITLDPSGEVNVDQREELTLNGTIDVQTEGGRNRFYGILITDLGRPVEVQRATENEEKNTITVKYITRYLLRVELLVSGAQPAQPGRIEISDFGLRSKNGFAEAYAVLRNPTDVNFRFHLRATLLDENDKPLAPPFQLSLPVKSASSGADRFESEIFSGATIDMQRKVPDPINPGEYTMELELRSNARPVKSVKKKITVKEGQFPAQQSVRSRLLSDVYIEPSRVALSRRPGGDRIVPMKITNESNQSISASIHMFPRGEPEKSVPWLTVRPTTFDIPQGRSQSVRISASTQGAGSQHNYAFMKVKVNPTKTVAGGTHKIPVSFLAQGKLNVNPSFGSLSFDREGNYPAAVLPVQNNGDVHVEMNAVMTLNTPFGNQVRVRGGFGSWVLPGESGEMRFRFEKVPLPGTYETNIKIDPGHDKDPITLQRSFEVK